MSCSLTVPSHSGGFIVDCAQRQGNAFGVHWPPPTVWRWWANPVHPSDQQSRISSEVFGSILHLLVELLEDCLISPAIEMSLS